MYKVLIVDDEPEMLEGLKILIDWQHYGFKIKDTSKNGLEAVEKIQNFRYDLVITDIRMPKLDGMELIKEIYNLKPLIKVMILSGYNDFKYAKQAIQFGVKGFLLKPIDEDELVEYLIEIKNELDNKHTIEHEIKKFSKVNRDKQLIDLTDGNLMDKEMETVVDKFLIPSSNCIYCVSLVEILELDSLASNNLEDAKLMKFAVRNIAEEIIQDDNNGVVFEDIQGRLGILLYTTEKNVSGIERCLQKIKNKVLKYFELNLVVGVGSYVDCIKDLNRSKNEAMQSIERRCFAKSGDVIFYSSFDFSAKLTWSVEWNYSPLLNAIEEMDLEKIHEQIEFLILEMKEKQLEKNVIQALSYNLVFGMCSLLRKHNIKSTDVFGIKENKTLAQGFVNLEHVKTWMTEICMIIINYLSQLVDTDEKIDVGQIIKYVDENYNKSINLKTLSEKYYMNTAYLGQLLKNALGEKFSDYLNKKRISEVKKMVFFQGFKVYDAINKAGYQNTEYFYRQFKRYENESFEEYKERVKSL